MFEQENQECSHCDDKCRELIEKFLTIALPVRVTPRVDVKPVKSECCGKAIITPRHGNCCKISDDGCCEFTIIQKMRIEIPVEFKAKTDIDKPFVDCEFKKNDCKDKDEHDIDRCKDDDKWKDHDKDCCKDDDKWKDHDKDCCKDDDKWKDHDKDCCKDDDKWKDHDKDKNKCY